MSLHSRTLAHLNLQNDDSWQESRIGDPTRIPDEKHPLTIIQDGAHSKRINAVADWLAENDFTPSSVTVAKQGGQDVIVIFYNNPGMIDTSRVPYASKAVVKVYKEIDGEAYAYEDDYETEPYNPFREGRAAAGSSFGCQGGRDGTLGMFLRDTKDEYYVLTAGHVLSEEPGLTEDLEKEVTSPSPDDKGKANALITSEAFKCQLQTFLLEGRQGSAWGPRGVREGYDGDLEESDLEHINNKLQRCYSTYKLWTERGRDQKGNTNLCSGAVSELSIKGTRMIDWGLAKVSCHERIGKNEIQIGEHTHSFHAGFQDPVPGMIVCKVGRSTGVTFGRIAAPKLAIVHTKKKTTLNWYVVPLRPYEVHRLLSGGTSYSCPDGRAPVTRQFASHGDAGAVILSYPSLTPVGMLTSNVGDTLGLEFPVACFVPFLDLLNRIKDKTGLVFNMNHTYSPNSDPSFRRYACEHWDVNTDFCSDSSSRSSTLADTNSSCSTLADANSRVLREE